MRAELDFIRQALNDDSGISFEVPIAFIIPKTLTASLFGDSSLLSCGGYYTDLRVWWYLPFPDTRQNSSANFASSQEQRGRDIHLNKLPRIRHNNHKLLCVPDCFPRKQNH